MHQVEPHPPRRSGLWATLAIAAVTSASAVAIGFPATSSADPEPAPPAPPTTAAAPPPAAPPSTAAAPAPGAPPSTAPPVAQGADGQPAPGDPNAAPPPPADPNAPPPPAADPNAGRITNAVGGFSYVLPAGWVESDASHLDYGSALLSKTTGQPPAPGQPPPVANDTRIVLGRLDQKLYASAEANNSKAALRLGSDMGEFFMPYPGTRINQETTTLTGANGIAGSASFYEVKFSDATKPNGQIWTGVVGSQAGSTPGAGAPQRWFVVWLGTANDPVDKGAAKALAESIQPASAPASPPVAAGPPAPGAPPASPAPGAPPPPAPAAPPPASPAPGAPAAPAGPAQAPAGEASPTPAPTPQRAVSA